MNSEGYFTTNDFDQYHAALDEVESYIKSMLYRFCSVNSIGVMSSRRIKEEKSIISKIFRKKKKNSNVDIKTEISDIAGLRIVFCDSDFACKLGDLDKQIHGFKDKKEVFKEKFFFASHVDNNCNIKAVYDFVDFLKKDDSYNIIREKDYISEPKKSGYQSYHINIKASNGCCVEIQIRNYVQHLFAEFEHDVRYKADEVTKQQCSAVCDECASMLYYISESNKPMPMDSGIAGFQKIMLPKK